MEADFLGGLSGATMAFGKSHRDPYATSVGHLVGKKARGVISRLAWGTVGALPVLLHSRLGGWGGGELDQVGGNATLPPQLSHATCVPPAAPVHRSGFGSLIPESLRKKAKFKTLGEWSQAGDQRHSLRGVLGPLGGESGNFLTRGRFFIKCDHSQHFIVIPILQTRKRELREANWHDLISWRGRFLQTNFLQRTVRAI